MSKVEKVEELKSVGLREVEKVDELKSDGLREENVSSDSEALKIYKQIKATVDAMGSDFDKFENKRVKAAGQRVRNNLLTCKKLSTDLRKVLITEIQGIPVKHRTKVVQELKSVGLREEEKKD